MEDNLATVTLDSRRQSFYLAPMTQKPAKKTIAPPYPEADPNPDFVAIEKEILAFWEKENVFEASVENRPEKNPDGSDNAYVFYDGPPFANGLPHYGHLLTG